MTFDTLARQAHSRTVLPTHSGFGQTIVPPAPIRPPVRDTTPNRWPAATDRNASYRRGLIFCLSLSWLGHLWLGLHLADLLGQPKTSDRPPPTQLIEVKWIIIQPNSPVTSSTPHRAAQGRLGKTGNRFKTPAPTTRVTSNNSPSRTSQVLDIAASTPLKTNDQSAVHPAPPRLDLSRILDDVRQVARDHAQQDLQAFDRRKPAIAPENLKAPAVEAREETETYALPGGYERRCTKRADGNKHCMRKQQDQDGIWNANIYMTDWSYKAKSDSDLASRVLQAVGKH